MDAIQDHKKFLLCGFYSYYKVLVSGHLQDQYLKKREICNVGFLSFWEPSYFSISFKSQHNTAASWAHCGFSKLFLMNIKIFLLPKLVSTGPLLNICHILLDLVLVVWLS